MGHGMYWQLWHTSDEAEHWIHYLYYKFTHYLPDADGEVAEAHEFADSSRGKEGGKLQLY